MPLAAEGDKGSERQVQGQEQVSVANPDNFHPHPENLHLLLHHRGSLRQNALQYPSHHSERINLLARVELQRMYKFVQYFNNVYTRNFVDLVESNKEV